ncbi:thiamine ABC transporter substrate-binding protein [Desulfosarcina cetonica]|uniref:thiamine ABC transporter substrate-binding protein n=1 Tax=Desulfosarcina cetonica TaxID=90730 RepID=UPI001C45D308|nr:thiamine ABC transporter substrate-binding protein [Desulfosarcina cetonica]
MGRALSADLFEEYTPPALARVPKTLQLDPTRRLTPVDYGDVCLNVDKAWFAQHHLAPPADLDALIDPRYKGLTVVQNPATSSPGLAFLLATIGRYGEDGYAAYWRQLRANDVYVSMGWSDAYYGQFSRAKGGTRPIVVSYASSPAAEVFYSEKKIFDSPTAAVLAPRTAFRQIEFVGILKGTKMPDVARRLVDFMLSETFQQDIPLNMWVFPAVEGTPLPEVFTRHAHQAAAPVLLDPQTIEANRDRWIDTWTEVVLR